MWTFCLAKRRPLSDDVGLPPRDAEKPSRREDIQGLRAVAVVTVVVYHAGLPLPGGFVGVDMFFVVSGFVITGMLWRERQQHGRIDLRQFYLRRVKRLGPALALVTTATLLASALVFSPFGEQGAIAATAVGATLFAANAVIAQVSGGYFDVAAEKNPLLHTWSLSVEEQFYFVFPVILLVGWRVGRRFTAERGGPIVAVVLVGAASFLASVSATGAQSMSFALGFYSPLVRVWEFAVGAVLALLVGVREVRLRTTVREALGILGATLLYLSMVLISSETAFPGWWALLPTGGTAVLLIAGTGGTSLISDLLSRRWMVAVGDRSYSIYLWHWPVVVAVGKVFPQYPLLLVVGSVVSLVPAFGSYRWVEQPLRGIELRSMRRRFAFGLLLIGVPITASFIIVVGSANGWWLNWPRPEVDQIDRVAFETCTDQPFDVASCTWNGGGDAGMVLLVGDSQAYAIAEGVIEAAHQLDLSTVVSSRSGCPFVGRDSTGPKALDCPSWQREVLDFALTRRPEVVVIANRSAGYATYGWRDLVPREADVVAGSGGDPLLATYRHGLEETVNRLAGNGISVVVVQNIPEPGDAVIDLTLLRRIAGRISVEAFDAEQFLSVREPVAQVEELVRDQHSNVVLLDPSDVLCSGTSCAVVRAGQAVYQDPAHLSLDAAIELVPALRTAIEKSLQ